MNLTSSPLRRGVVAAVCLGTMMMSGPSFSAQRDIDLLKSYIGEWRGRGTMNNSGEKETVVCRMGITNAETAKVNFNGRCTLAGGNLAIAGTMAWVNERNRYEAVMSSNTNFSGIAVGRRRGETIDFTLRERNPDTGAEVSIDVGLALISGRIEVDFTITDRATGASTKATIPFTK